MNKTITKFQALLGCLLLIAVFSAQSSLPFCQPTIQTPDIDQDGDLGCDDPPPAAFGSGVANGEPFQIYPFASDSADQWFIVSIDDLKLEQNDQITLMEYHGQRTTGQDNILGSLVIRNAHGFAQTTINFNDNSSPSPVFEVFWDWEGAISTLDTDRAPLGSEVSNGLVPLLTDQTEVCLHIQWQRAIPANGTLGFVNIEIQELPNIGLTTAPFTMANRIIPGQADQIKSVRAGLVVPPTDLANATGEAILTPTTYANCTGPQ